MRVVHISTYDVKGGAARSAYRLHAGLLARGVESRLLVKRKTTAASEIVEAELQRDEAAQRTHKAWKLVQREWIDENRTPLSNTHFSIAHPGWDLAGHAAVQCADIVHLHWTWWLASPQGVARLCQLGKPLVWTFHDQRAFTGGCHFSAGCRRFENDCDPCPQLREDPFHLTRAALADSVAALAPQRIVIACPSRWLATAARQSRVCGEHRIETIPYGIDTEVFQPVNRAAARQQLDISPGAFCFLFGADNTAETRKGFPDLVEAMRLAGRDPEFQRAVSDGHVRFFSFGAPRTADASIFPVPMTDLGRIISEAELARIYSAVDVFLLPSREDNLPNVLLESMACGTPVLACEVGGIPDVVRPGSNGWLVPPRAPAELGAAMVSVAREREAVLRIAAKCRPCITEKHTLDAQASAYEALYAGLAPIGVEAAGGGTARPCAPMAAPGAAIAGLFPELSAGARKRRRSAALLRWFRKPRADERAASDLL